LPRPDGAAEPRLNWRETDIDGPSYGIPIEIPSSHCGPRMTHGALLHARESGERDPIQRYARLAGVLGLITIVAGGFGEAYVPGVVFVAGDPAETAQRILANESLFRWGFAGYLVEALCDAALTMVFWVLVRPVHRNFAMLMVVLRIISTCGFGAAQVLYFAALPTLRGSRTVATLEPAQMQALAYVLLRTAAFGGALFSMFYGVANIVFGWLLHRSGFVPRVFGVAMILMGLAFAARTFLLVLAPAYASGLLPATAAVAFIPFILWLLVKGVDEEAWRRAVRAAG
jgi:Domain of unknown function (DUF4386)